MMETGVSALENVAGTADELTLAMRKSAEVVCDNIVEDLKSDAIVDDAKRKRRQAKAKIKTAKIDIEINDLVKQINTKTDLEAEAA